MSCECSNFLVEIFREGTHGGSAYSQILGSPVVMSQFRGNEILNPTLQPRAPFRPFKAEIAGDPSIITRKSVSNSSYVTMTRGKEPLFFQLSIT